MLTCKEIINKLISLIFLLIVFCCHCYGQKLNTSKIDSFLNLLASQNAAMGSIAIAKNGIVQYQKAIGYSSIENGKKIQANIKTTYRVGSITKMFTAVMVFQLVEEGKIKLDEKLSAYFPGIPNADKITISNMLYHRSGLHDYTHDTNFADWMDKPITQNELLKIITEKGSDFEPGTNADYCNSNYLLLGYIVEKICKMPYAIAVKKRILQKINLKDTYYGNSVNTRSNKSFSYKYGGNTWSKSASTNLSIHGGAGAIVSTPTDIARFINALFSSKLVNKASFLKMKTMIDGYGMGMFSNKYGSAPSFGHNGKIEEFYSALWYFPAEKLSIAYCTNGINYPRADLIEGVLKICFNQQFVLPFSKAINLTGDQLDRFIGKYASEQITVNCSRDSTTLSVETKGKVFELKPIAENYFMHAETGYFFEFEAEKGSLLIKEADNVYKLERKK